MNVSTLWLALLLLVLIWPPRDSCAADRQEIIDACRDGYLQARAAIRTLSCTTDVFSTEQRGINPTSGKELIIPAQTTRLVWQEDRDVARCTLKMENNTQTFEYSWKDGVLKHLKGTPNGKSTSHVGRIDGPDGITHVMTPWQSALMKRPEVFTAMLTRGKIVDAVAETVEGRKCYRLSLDIDGAREDTWFDIQNNYLVRKWRYYPVADKPAVYHVSTVTRFVEYKPGVFFPAAVEKVLMVDGKVTSRDACTFRDVKINDPVDSAKLELKFPSGTLVTDTRKSVTYTVGENEQPLSEPEPIPKSAQPGSLMPTALEPPPSYRPYWIAGAVAVVLAVAVTVYLRRRRDA